MGLCQKQETLISFYLVKMKKRILITGTNGLVGQSVLQQVAITGSTDQYEIMSFVRANPVKKYANVKYVKGDLKKTIPQEIKDFDPHIVIHLASLLKGGTSDDYWSVNVLGTQKILDQMGMSLRLFVYNSSMSVYGQGPFSRPVQENSLCSPETDLSKSRHEAELRIKRFCEAKGIGAFLLRPRFILGGQDKSTLPSLQKTSLGRLKLGHEEQRLSYIHVDDYARIVAKLISPDCCIDRCEALNISYKEPVKLSHLLDLLNPGRRSKYLVRLPLKRLISFMSLFGRSSLLTKLELIGQDQILSSKKIKTYVPAHYLENDNHQKLETAIRDYMELIT